MDNSTHFKNKNYLKLFSKLEVAKNQDEKCKIIKKMHANVYRNGGEIIPAIPKNATAFDPDVKGIKGDKLGRTPFMLGEVKIK